MGGEDAEAILLDVDIDDADQSMIARWGCLRAANLAWGCGDAETATRVLAEVKASVSAEAAVCLIDALQLSIGFFSGDVETTIERGPNLCDSDAVPMATVWVAIATCGALVAAGRFSEVRRIADAGLRAAALCKAGSQRFAIGLAEVMVATAAGDYSAADRIAGRYAAMAAGLPAAEAMVDAMLGLVHVTRGELSSACAALGRSISTLQGFPSPWLLVVAALHAQAEGARGDSEAAAAALRRAEQAYGPHVAVFLPELELARAWERAAAVTPRPPRRTRCGRRKPRKRPGCTSRKCGHAMHPFASAIVGRPRESRNSSDLEHRIGTGGRRPCPRLAQRDPALLDAAAHEFADLGALAFAADVGACGQRTRPPGQPPQGDRVVDVGARPGRSMRIAHTGARGRSAPASLQRS
ncbi:hypothetical protein MTIM_15270 [Mycobacterium timonense]|uniref:Uncharacterized protein n=1 Tax=Mycobacterium timonense TaxID=701043 RepID=A0A7I9Z426_9MYCO|nr:hypothetical protein MTIM_15270 [Mycobacterium timonense]